MSLQLAEQFEANEQYEQALEEYKKLYASNPDDVGLLERLGHISLILDKTINSIFEFQSKERDRKLIKAKLNNLY